MSESNKFTPGAWSLDESRHAGCINRINPFRHIAMVSAYQATKEDKEENSANALLISAAPDLLEALEGVLRISDLWLPHEIEEQHGEEMYVLHMARNKMIAAVEKARGQQ